MSGDAKMCARPFCGVRFSACDADLHETPAALQAIIGETGSACPDCDTSGFGFVTEYRMDSRPVHLLVVWHADDCPTLINGGYVIAALPETALKTGAAISEALTGITEEDIRAGEFAVLHDKLLRRHSHGEIVLPEWTVRTSRKITARDAEQEADAGGPSRAAIAAAIAGFYDDASNGLHARMRAALEAAAPFLADERPAQEGGQETETGG